MPLALSSDSSAAITIGVYKPKPSSTIDDVLRHLCKASKPLEDSGCVKSVFLKDLTSGSWVAVYSIWETGSPGEASVSSLPGMQAFQQEISRVADTVDCSRYELSCEECKEANPVAQFSKGDAVHLRWIMANAGRQEVLSYACLAVLKAYFKTIEELLSCTFYKSLDGRKIAGLGIWENAQAAYSFISSPEGPPGEPYWKSLGARLTCGICEVVYVTGEGDD